MPSHCHFRKVFSDHAEENSEKQPRDLVAVSAVPQEPQFVAEQLEDL